MRHRPPCPFGFTLLALVLVFGRGTPATADQSQRLELTSGWTLQSSVKVNASGQVLSQVGHQTVGWYTVGVPSTVVGGLVENGTFADPYFGMNLRDIPGTTYPIGERFSLLPTPADSPFKPSWWYRREFELPPGGGDRRAWLHFDGINYRANIWVNGERIADATQVAGAFRRYEFDVTPHVRRGARNAVAVEVFAPEPGDLAIMWVDWNPTPADKNMGLWGEVYLTESGPVALRHAHVVPALDLPGLGAAHLTVSADVWNATDRAVSATVRGAIENTRFDRTVSLQFRIEAIPRRM